ncbi:GIY-YIG nuclease family protein [Cyclobacterium plantarum]|uniref:GIY-YIG nuclease family protein n=1 Tax=Cyclobacterium plantarum TaxID=2716263 RepID=A0ABX0H944_9BACT|nr:GIY-YIG nuclease family protein [Cyclobacterium plantarum]NHE58409.1 GIY-YIG nuclease family protein [Cyclobacterium plantarum]
MFTVYALYSEKFDKIYIGFTSNLQKRLISHNELGTKGWTIAFRPWKLIHTETFKSKKEAMNREKHLKTGVGREFIRNLIPKI